jgi:amylosucrase
MFDNSMKDRWLEQQTQISYRCLELQLDEHFSAFAEANAQGWVVLKSRLEKHFPQLFLLYFSLYNNQSDFDFHLKDLLIRVVNSWIERSAELKQLDADRENNPYWYQSNQMLGGVCYIDLFAGNLETLRSKIPYFKELGLTYLHIMPPFKVPEKENDGGYAVSSYREVNPAIGTIQDLSNLADDLRNEGISLALDFIFNHTSDEHSWALRARNGDPTYQAYYHIFPDRQMPDTYEANLREIFPEEHTGAFTFCEENDSWVWTTFHTYQWDLNYANPVIFNNMIDEMLFLANLGVEILRLDAVAFTWKELGTSCENLPEAHTLIQAFNAAARIAAPALLFKSEAIVHPDQVIKYIHIGECQLSYNPLQMALLWNSLATRKVRLLSQALRRRNKIPDGCAWINYLRVHDDIGWTFSDEDAARLNINAYDHRQFLNKFYTGKFPGSFARGVSFQENSITGDARISGTAASLAGLEKALNEETDHEVELAVRRILLLHGITLTTNGIPLIYLGDEVGMLNDYSYLSDPSKAQDSRWVHRSTTDWAKMDRRFNAKSLEGRIYLQLKQLIKLRQENIAFSGYDLEVIDTDNDHVLGYIRQNEGQRVLVFANFTEEEQTLPGNLLRLHSLGKKFANLINGVSLPLGDLILEPYRFLCLAADKSKS